MIRAIVNCGKWRIGHLPLGGPAEVLLLDEAGQGCVLEKGLKRVKRIPQVGRLFVQRKGASFLLGGL